MGFSTLAIKTDSHRKLKLLAIVLDMPMSTIIEQLVDKLVQDVRNDSAPFASPSIGLFNKKNKHE